MKGNHFNPHANHNLADECIAYALATGMTLIDDLDALERDAERSLRRQRYERRKARGH
ncbi:MAG: hypothetical protein ACKO0Z_04605 [Betaproteobacteria bacterium]